MNFWNNVKDFVLNVIGVGITGFVTGAVIAAVPFVQGSVFDWKLLGMTALAGGVLGALKSIYDWMDANKKVTAVGTKAKPKRTVASYLRII